MDIISKTSAISRSNSKQHHSDAETKPSSVGGRGLFATKSYSAGDALLSLDRPLIAVLDKARVDDTCAWCFAWTELPVPSGAGINQASMVNWCTGCKKVKYCSKRCQAQAWKAGHKRECKVFAGQSDLIPNTVAAAMCIVSGISNGDDRCSDVLRMETHRDDFEKVGGKKLEAMQLMAHTAAKLMGSKDSSLPSKMETAMCVLMCNSSRVVSSTFDPLGLALDPWTSSINHSCTPNAVIVFDGPSLTVRTLEKIHNGEEIFISYVDTVAPFGVRHTELEDQYFFVCTCPRCKLGSSAPQDAFLDPGPGFDERIKIIDDMIPQIKRDPAWRQHLLGESTQEERLSALQLYAFSYLESPDAEKSEQDPAKFRRIITICRNTGIWPLTRAPLPQLYQQYAVACLGAKRYNEALIALLRLHILIDPTTYPQTHHPVRVVHAWTLATLTKAVSSEPEAPFCKALQACGVDLSVLFLALLTEVHDQVSKSHGSESQLARMVESVWQTMMGPGGDLELQYAQVGVKQNQWKGFLSIQIKDLWPKIKAFAEDEGLAAQIDEAMAA